MVQWLDHLFLKSIFIGRELTKSKRPVNEELDATPRSKRSGELKFQALFFVCENIRESFLGGNGEGGIPEPIPNSEVKPLIADGTIHKSMEE